MTADIHALTGAYVLNAIPDAERAAFEHHLAECEACAQEVRELRATATRLGEAAADTPPSDLKARVMAGIADVRQVPPTGDDELAARRARTSWVTRILAAAAAVAALAAIAMGVVVAGDRADLDQTRTQAAAVQRLLTAADAQLVRHTDGALTATMVVSRGRNEVLLLSDGMPQAPDGRTYQVWLMGEHKRSIGFMSPDGNGRATLHDQTGIADAQMLGVTVEPAGGSPQPTSSPVLVLALPA